MKRPTIRVSFAIRRNRLLENGESTILLRITVNGERQELTTNRTIDPQSWDQDKGKSNGYSRTAGCSGNCPQRQGFPAGKNQIDLWDTGTVCRS